MKTKIIVREKRTVADKIVLALTGCMFLLLGYVLLRSCGVVNFAALNRIETPVLVAGAALDLMSWYATAPGAGPTAMTIMDQAVIRNGSRDRYAIQVVGAWTKCQAVGFTEFIFPSGNDQNRNLRWRNTVINAPRNNIGRMPLYVRPQDPLTVNASGSATAGDVELFHALVYYEDLMGVDAHLITTATLYRRGIRAVTVEDSVTSVAAASYATTRKLNQGSDLLKADTLYAIVGANIGAACGALWISGTDIGGLRVGIPGTTELQQTRDFFADLSDVSGLPLIPVFNSGNRGGITIGAVQDENLGAVPFSWNLVEIGPAAGEAAVSVAVS